MREDPRRNQSSAALPYFAMRKPEPEVPNHYSDVSDIKDLEIPCHQRHRATNSDPKFSQYWPEIPKCYVDGILESIHPKNV